MPNLRLFYRKDEINSDKEKSRHLAMMEEIEEMRIKRGRLSLPATIERKSNAEMEHYRYGLSPLQWKSKNSRQ